MKEPTQMSEASWKLPRNVLAKHKEVKVGDVNLKWVWSEWMNEDFKVIIYDLSRGDTLTSTMRQNQWSTEGHKWKINGVILGLIRCPTFRVRVIIIISDQYHIYTLIGCVSVRPVFVFFVFFLILLGSFLPVKTWPGETCSIWLYELHTLTTFSPMTGEPMGLGAKVPHLPRS